MKFNSKELLDDLTNQTHGHIKNINNFLLLEDRIRNQKTTD